MIIRSQTREKRQEFMIHVHRIETEEVEADKLRLKQILLNILSNAVKYTPKGGKIVFDITEVPKKKGSFAQYQFRISDNGQGMGEEYLKNLLIHSAGKCKALLIRFPERVLECQLPRAWWS